MSDDTEPAYDLTEANNSGSNASKPKSIKLGGLPHSWCNPSQWFPQYQQGDQIMPFSSPSEDWEQLRGRSGCALLRNGEVIDYFVTRMN